MQLVVESGATKSTWVLFDGERTYDTQVLEGINPTSNPNSVEYITKYTPADEQIDRLYFYGAGVSSPVAKSLLQEALRKKFAKTELHLRHDILAAALSISSGCESVVSILGTGTNTVVFDGTDIIESPKAMGYMFADYGSGFHLGKILIQRYYSNQMPQQDLGIFYDTYIKGQPDLLFRIYKAPKPNYATAKLSYFLSECTEELRGEVLKEAFSAFFKYQIEPLKNAEGKPLNFVGSISEVFKSYLIKEAELRGYRIGTIEGNPIHGLIEYHMNK